MVKNNNDNKILNQQFQVNINRNLSKITKLKSNINVNGVEKVIEDKDDSEEENFNTVKNVDSLEDSISGFITDICGENKKIINPTKTNTSDDTSSETISKNLSMSINKISNFLDDTFMEDILQKGINSTINNIEKYKNSMRKVKDSNITKNNKNT